MSILQELTLITASSDGADWNPASDMQALARVWRDGQKKDCASLSSPSSPSPSYASLTWLLSVVLQASCTVSSQRAPSRRRVRRAHLRFDPLPRPRRELTVSLRRLARTQSSSVSRTSRTCRASSSTPRRTSSGTIRATTCASSSSTTSRRARCARLSLRRRRRCSDCELTCVPMLSTTHRRTTCSSASAARAASRSLALPPCSTATRRRASLSLARSTSFSCFCAG